VRPPCRIPAARRCGAALFTSRHATRGPTQSSCSGPLNNCSFRRDPPIYNQYTPNLRHLTFTAVCQGVLDILPYLPAFTHWESITLRYLGRGRRRVVRRAIPGATVVLPAPLGERHHDSPLARDEGSPPAPQRAGNIALRGGADAS
jgi:hypothetical protein